MQVLFNQQDGRYLCLLDADEVVLLQHSLPQPLKPSVLLQQIAALPLDDAIVNAIARAADTHPHMFVDQDDRQMTFEFWAQAVLAGRWKVPGIGELRMQKLREALPTVPVPG